MREVVTEESLPRAVIPGRPLAGRKGLDHAVFIDVDSPSLWPRRREEAKEKGKEQ